MRNLSSRRVDLSSGGQAFFLQYLLSLKLDGECARDFFKREGRVDTSFVSKSVVIYANPVMHVLLQIALNYDSGAF